MLLGIVGKSGSGKSTMAEYLVRSRKYTAIALADPLKRFTKEVYGFTNAQLWGPSEARNAPDPRYLREDGTYLTPREALQKLGTEWGRSCYENTWTDLCIKYTQRILSGEAYDPTRGLSPSLLDKVFKYIPGGVVVSDIRYENEAANLREGGFIIVRLDAEWAAPLSSGVSGHSSEGLDIPDDLVDCVIKVPKGLPTFYSRIDSFLEKVGDYRIGYLPKRSATGGRKEAPQPVIAQLSFPFMEPQSNKAEGGA